MNVTSVLDALVGITLNGRYALVARLGAGGMGAVYEAHDTRLDRRIAVKIILPQYGMDPNWIAMFIEEARTIAGLRHPHILTIYDIGSQPLATTPAPAASSSPPTTSPPALVYLVLEYAEGGALSRRLAAGPQTLAQVALVLRALADGLDYAHTQRIIHLDLKPANILLDAQDRVKIADFGLAQFLGNATHLSGPVGGTRGYMSPEQLLGIEIGPQADVYALGVIVYEMLTGQVPVLGMDTQGAWTVALPVALPSDLEPVLRLALAPLRRNRYPTAGAFAAAFSTALQPAMPAPSPLGAGIAPVAPPPPRPPRVPPAGGLLALLAGNPSTVPPLPLPARALPTMTPLRDALNDLGQTCAANPNMNETELVAYVFRAGGVLDALGYIAPGQDALLERQGADLILRAFNGRPLAVLEFKRPSRSPQEGLAQLEQMYVARLLPDVGVLCNGRELWIYRRAGTGLYHPPILQVPLGNITDQQAEAVYNLLGRRELDLRDLGAVETAVRDLARYPIPVRGPADPGGSAFLDRFALTTTTPFGRLVAALAAALPAMLAGSSFTQGAYAFWRRIYARELQRDDVPLTWQPLIPAGGADGLYHLMFALESGYAVLARLLLARAMENHSFPHLDLITTLVGALRTELRQGRLEPAAYANALHQLFDYTGRQAFNAIFASDIFDWWHDIGAVPAAAPVGDRLAEAILAVFEFDFQPMNGDLLGELYQAYFDRDTRKALGEFYTPPEIVDFILDEVGYTIDNGSIRTARLLDPACGSGTFLVHALVLQREVLDRTVLSFKA